MNHSAAGGPIRTPWFHGWNIVAVRIVAQMAALALTINCFTLFLHGWSAEFHAPVSTLTVSVALFSLGAAIASPFIGVAVDRFPARRLFGGALAGLALFHLLMSFATAGWQVVALYVAILPLAVGLSASVPCQAAVSRWFQHGRVGLAMGVTAMGMELGGVIFPRLIAAELPLVGWRSIFQLAAGVIALVILPLVVLVMRNPSDAEGAARREAHGVAEGAAAGPSITLMDILRRWNFWIVIAAFLPIQSVAMAMLLNLAPVAASRGFDARTAGGFLIVWSLASMAAKAGAGALADRFGNRLPLVGTALFSACGAALLAFAGSQSLLFGAGVVLIGFSGAIWTLSASAMAAEFGAAGFGRAFGLICTLVPIASFAPPIFARVQEMSGSYVNGLIGLAVLTLVGAVAAAMMKEDRAALAAAGRVRVAH